jgi:hypothetical protein
VFNIIIFYAPSYYPLFVCLSPGFATIKLNNRRKNNIVTTGLKNQNQIRNNVTDQHLYDNSRLKMAVNIFRKHKDEMRAGLSEKYPNHFKKFESVEIQRKEFNEFQRKMPICVPKAQNVLKHSALPVFVANEHQWTSAKKSDQLDIVMKTCLELIQLGYIAKEDFHYIDQRKAVSESESETTPNKQKKKKKMDVPVVEPYQELHRHLFLSSSLSSLPSPSPSKSTTASIVTPLGPLLTEVRDKKMIESAPPECLLPMGLIDGPIKNALLVQGLLELDFHCFGDAIDNEEKFSQLVKKSILTVLSPTKVQSPFHHGCCEGVTNKQLLGYLYRLDGRFNQKNSGQFRENAVTALRIFKDNYDSNLERSEIVPRKNLTLMEYLSWVNNPPSNLPLVTPQQPSHSGSTSTSYEITGRFTGVNSIIKSQSNNITSSEKPLAMYAMLRNIMYDCNISGTQFMKVMCYTSAYFTGEVDLDCIAAEKTLRLQCYRLRMVDNLGFGTELLENLQSYPWSGITICIDDTPLGQSNAKSIILRSKTEQNFESITKNFFLAFPNSFVKVAKRQSELILDVIERFCGGRHNELFLRFCICCNGVTVDHAAKAEARNVLNLMKKTATDILAERNQSLSDYVGFPKMKSGVFGDAFHKHSLWIAAGLAKVVSKERGSKTKEVISATSLPLDISYYMRKEPTVKEERCRIFNGKNTRKIPGCTKERWETGAKAKAWVLEGMDIPSSTNHAEMFIPDFFYSEMRIYPNSSWQFRICDAVTSAIHSPQILVAMTFEVEVQQKIWKDLNRVSRMKSVHGNDQGCDFRGYLSYLHFTVGPLVSACAVNPFDFFTKTKASIDVLRDYRICRIEIIQKNGTLWLKKLDPRWCAKINCAHQHNQKIVKLRDTVWVDLENMKLYDDHFAVTNEEEEDDDDDHVDVQATVFKLIIDSEDYLVNNNISTEDAALLEENKVRCAAKTMKQQMIYWHREHYRGLCVLFFLTVAGMGRGCARWLIRLARTHKPDILPDFNENVEVDVSFQYDSFFADIYNAETSASRTLIEIDVIEWVERFGLFQQRDVFVDLLALTQNDAKSRQRDDTVIRFCEFYPHLHRAFRDGLDSTGHSNYICETMNSIAAHKTKFGDSVETRDAKLNEHVNNQRYINDITRMIGTTEEEVAAKRLSGKNVRLKPGDTKEKGKALATEMLRRCLQNYPEAKKQGLPSINELQRRVTADASFKKRVQDEFIAKYRDLDPEEMNALEEKYAVLQQKNEGDYGESDIPEYHIVREH